MIPFVKLNKVSGSLGVSPTSNPVGILALITPLIMGPSTPTLQTKPSNVNALCGYSLTDEIAEYVIDESGNPILICQQTPSTAAVFGTPVYVGSGSLGGGGFIVADAGFAAVDDFLVTVRFILGGTTGTGPISYQYSIDARAPNDVNKSWSPVQALGTGLVITIPNTGIIIDLTTAKTTVTGDYFTVNVKGPRLTDADVSAALTRLGRANLPWEVVMPEGIDASSTTEGNLDTFLSGLEAGGRYRAFICGARLRTQATETEAQYLTSLTAAWTSAASIRGSVTADGGYLTSVPRGIDMVRKASIAYAARLMSIDVTTDAARVKDGPLAAVRIVDGDGNGQYHDESNDPGLDDQRLVTFRSFNNKAGVYITNPRVISAPGNDFQLMQQVRTMNRACELCFGALVDELSDGVFTDRVTGFIREDSAQKVEQGPNAAMRAELGKKVNFVGFELSRDDVLTPPSAVFTGDVSLLMPIYIKGFTVSASLVRTVTVSGSVSG